MLPHAPGVQMQAIPEDAIPEESGDEDEEDPDKRISSKTQTQGPVLPSVGTSDSLHCPGSTFLPSYLSVGKLKFQVPSPIETVREPEFPPPLLLVPFPQCLLEDTQGSIAHRLTGQESALSQYFPLLPSLFF